MNAWIFDIDGVITDPVTKRIKYPQIIDFLIGKLSKNEPVGLNTGRSLSWTEERVLNPLILKLKDKSILENLIICAENGAVSATFTKGELSKYKDSNFTVPAFIADEVRKSIKDTKLISFDESKETMVTVEMQDGASLEEFRKEQEILDKRLNEFLEEKKLLEEYVLRPNPIATDIYKKTVGKTFGTKKILNWLKEKNLEIDFFYIFGDAFSDLEISDQIKKEGFPLEFIFVGPRKDLDMSGKDYKISFSKARWTEGTVEFLNNL